MDKLQEDYEAGRIMIDDHNHRKKEIEDTRQFTLPL